jgi:hypothetical protein
MMICEGPSHNFISSGGHDWQERSTVTLIELRRQPNGGEGPASVCITKPTKDIFHNEPEWIRNEGWS